MKNADIAHLVAEALETIVGGVALNPDDRERVLAAARVIRVGEALLPVGEALARSARAPKKRAPSTTPKPKEG